MKRQFINFTRVLILFALIPLICGIVILSVMSLRTSTESIEDNIKEELNLAATSLKEHYEEDIENGTDLTDGFCTYDTAYIDRVASTGIDLTLFKDDIRFVTSIRDADGKRIEGTAANSSIWASVKRGNDYYSDDVVINGKDYYVYYLPLNENGNVVGMAFAGKPADAVSSLKTSITVKTLAYSGVTILVFLVLAYLISKKITKALNAVTDGIETLSNGDPVNITAKSNIRETGTLITSAKRLSERLSGSMSEIRESSGKLKDAVNSTANLAKDSANGAKQITESIGNLSQATENMAESVQNINANVASMGTMIENIVENTGNLSKSSKEMLSANTEAGNCVSDIVESSKISASAISDISKQIAETNSSISRIDEMTSLITEIADQTSLLSLNASIEAARAGEGGRGFSVVAEEIKRLAEQSNESAMKIKETIADMLEKSSKCVEQSKEIGEMISKEQALLKTTNEKFSILKTEIDNSVGMIGSVAETTLKINQSKETIMEAINELSAVSEKTAATNAEVSRSVSLISENVSKVSDDSERMNELSESLSDAVSYFKM